MEFALWQYLLLFILIGFSGFIDSIAGGGGLISVPTYLALGLPADLLLGTNKCVSSTGTTIAVFRYVRNRTILWKTVGYAIVAALIGSAIGASLSRFLSRESLFIILLVVIPLLFFLQSRHVVAADRLDTLTAPQIALRSALAGLIIGGYDGIFGPGTGTFLLLSFMVFLRMTPRQASANARIVNYASNLAAFVFFLFNGQILWQVAGVAIAGSICGNWLGSGLVLKNADRIVVPVFRFVLFLLLIKCAYDLFVP